MLPETKKGTILYVEDNPDNRSLIRRVLESEDYVVIEAVNAGQALENLENGNIDLVLMDINIRGDVDGIETARMIKSGFNIPVVYVTSHSDGPTLERAKATKPDGFIVKPFEDNDLRVAIELALKR